MSLNFRWRSTDIHQHASSRTSFRREEPLTDVAHNNWLKRTAHKFLRGLGLTAIAFSNINCPSPVSSPATDTTQITTDAKQNSNDAQSAQSKLSDPK